MSSYEGAFSHSFRELQVMGLWNFESNNPLKVRLYTMYRFATMTNLFIIMVLLCIDFVLSLNDVLKWSFNLCLTIIAVATFFKTGTILWHIDEINSLRKDLNRDLSTESDENRKILTDAAKEFSIVFRTTIVFFYILFFVWLSVPFSGVDDIRLPLQMWLPFDSTVSPIYEIIYIFNGIVGIFLVITVHGTNTSIVGLTARICAEYDILKNNIAKFCRQFEDSIPISDERTSQLREIIRHHQRIIGFVERLQKCYEPPLTVQFIGSPILLMNIGLDILLVSSKFSLRLLMQIQYIFTTSVDLGLYCFFGTRLVLKSEEVANVIFGSEWHSMSPTYRRTLCSIIQRSQKPPRLTVGRMFTINLNLYLEILRITYNTLAVMWQLTSAVTRT